MFLAPLLALALSPAAPPNSYFGINGSKLYHNVVNGTTERSAPRFAWMKELGVRWDRIDLWWNVLEPRRGEWNWATSDESFRTYEANGVQWYPILCYGAEWFEKGRNSPRDPQDFKDFAEYAYRTVRRYKGRAPVWALWNEPNILPFWAPQPSVDDYVRLMKATYPRFKEADPAAKLAAPVVAPLGKWDRGFIERMYQQGGGKFFDVFDYHYYRHYPPEEEVPRELAEIRAVMRRYDREKSIWLSEAGVTSIGRTPAEHAALVARHHLVALANGVDKFFYFDLQNWQDDKPEQWDTQLGLVDAAGRRKPAFFAYKTLIERVDGRKIVGYLAGLPTAVHGVLLFSPKTSQYDLAIWKSAKGPRYFEFARGAGFHLMDAYGKPLGSSPRIQLREAPVYALGVQGAAYLPLAGVRFDPPMTILAAGESGSLPIWRDLRVAKSVTVSPEASPKGVAWNPKAGTVHVASDVTPGVYTLRARVGYPGGDHRIEGQIEVLPQATVKFRPVMAGSELSLQVSVQNLTRRSMTHSLTLATTPPSASVTAPSQTLPPSGRLDLEFPNDGRFGSAQSEQAWWPVFGPVVGRKLRTYPLTFGGAAPKVDGDLRDWQAIPVLRLNANSTRLPDEARPFSLAETSALCRARVVDGVLYFAAEVRDDDPMVNVEQPLTLWKGDSFELYFGAAGPTSRSALDKSVDFQLGLAPTGAAKRPVQFWFHIDKPLTRGSAASRRTSTGWIIEAAYVLDEIGVTTKQLEGRYFGFDVKLNDLDRGDWAPAGNVPGRSLIWSGSGSNWIDPSGWGIGVRRRIE